MGKKMKLVLDDLKVTSFVTELEEKKARDAKGGATNTCTCDTSPGCCESLDVPGCTETCNTCEGACYSDWTRCVTNCGTCHSDCTCPLATC